MQYLHNCKLVTVSNRTTNRIVYSCGQKSTVREVGKVHEHDEMSRAMAWDGGPVACIGGSANR